MATQGNRHQPGLSQEIGDSHLFRLPTQTPAAPRRGHPGATLTQLGGSGHTLPPGETVSPSAHRGQEGMWEGALSTEGAPAPPTCSLRSSCSTSGGMLSAGGAAGTPPPRCCPPGACVPAGHREAEGRRETDNTDRHRIPPVGMPPREPGAVGARRLLGGPRAGAAHAEAQ